MDVTSISGIGLSSAAALKDHGIETARQLAEMKVEDLVKVPGFGVVRARQIIERAQEIVSAVIEQPQGVEARKEVEQKKPKKKKTEKKPDKNKKDPKSKKDKDAH